MSHSLQVQLRHIFRDAVRAAFADINPSFQVEVTKSTQEKFGHYQANCAMKLASELKLPPRKVAEEIVKQVEQKKPTEIESLEIAGPGFINIKLTPEFLAETVTNFLNHEESQPEKREKIVIDFSSPNIAKEMHVGHLRSTIIGDCLARTFEFLGHDVLRLNHVGDYGTSFGMLIAYMKAYCKESMENVERISLSDLVLFYKKAKALFDEDQDFKRQSQLQVVALQQGEKEAFEIWQKICEISRKAYQEIYTLLDVRLIERGESFYGPFLAQVVSDCEKKGIVSLSDGAKCIFLEGFQNREGEPLPFMIQKSDGGYNYDTTDLAALLHRIEVEKADRIIIVTDAGQATHFQMVFAAGEKVGYLDRTKVRVDHVPFGLVLGPDGKKFKTRSGETEKLIDLLTTAELRALDIVKERNPEWSVELQGEVSKTLGIGAVKYADLSCNRISDYSFSYDRMLKFEGNTVAFVMYAYVRAESIKRKLQYTAHTSVEKNELNLAHPTEIQLALHLARFDEMIDQIVQDLLPNRLTDYLYELAERFNAFFRDCRVEGAKEEKSRLLLCEATSRTLKLGFHLLGIGTCERM